MTPQNDSEHMYLKSSTTRLLPLLAVALAVFAVLGATLLPRPWSIILALIACAGAGACLGVVLRARGGTRTGS